jgi:dCMP deaminase
MNKWDKRFVELAEHVAGWSKDPSTKVGAVLVSPDRSQVVLGYNGFPRGVHDADYRYQDKEMKYDRVVHAELNAILNSTVRPIGWTLYVSPLPPCNECAKAIIQSGIKKIIWKDGKTSDKWKDSFMTSYQMFEEAGVEVECLNLE